MARPFLLSLAVLSLLLLQEPRIAVLHLTLVSRRNSSTASVAFSHRSLTEGARGCLHQQSFSIRLHILSLWGAHASHLAKR